MNNLPNLSEWHEVPRGTSIPDGITWVLVSPGGSFTSYNFGTSTSNYAPETKFYTAGPIERSLAQVIETAYNNFGDWEYAAQAARDFLAPKETLPPIVIDGDNDKWVRNDEGTYDLFGEEDNFYHGMTIDYIREKYGIQRD